MIFNNLTADEVNSVHELFLFLHCLKIIGTVHTETKGVQMTEFGKPRYYDLIFQSYDHTTRGQVSAEERICAYFRASEKLAEESGQE